MAVLTYANLKNLAFDRAQVNVTTDAPVSDTEFARFINEAYSDVWQISGGRPKTVASATAWTSANSATGQVTGILTDVEDIIHVWASTTSGSVGTSAGDTELDRVELSYIMALRADGVGLPTYAATTPPKVYALSRKATTTPASVNLLQLDYWPSVTGFFLPIMYVPQFTEIDSATVTTPDVNDLESRDIGLLCAARIAQMVQRNDLVPGILADVSMRTQAALARKMAALMDGKQDTP